MIVVRHICDDHSIQDHVQATLCAEILVCVVLGDLVKLYRLKDHVLRHLTLHETASTSAQRRRFGRGPILLLRPVGCKRLLGGRSKRKMGSS